MEDNETEWIESPQGWEDNNIDNDENDTTTNSLFGDPDPRDTFHFQIQTQKEDDSSTAATTTITKKVKISGFKLDSNETAKSTGVTLWEGSTPLAKYIMSYSKDYIKEKKVLELGAGLGLVGIVAHHLGASQMVLTDGDTHTLQKMRENVNQNCDNDESCNIDNIITCRQLLWGTEQCQTLRAEYESFDTILAADVIYTPTSIEPLFDTVMTFLPKSHGKFLLSWFTRVNGVTIETVLDAAKSRHLEWTETKEGIYIFVHGEEAK